MLILVAVVMLFMAAIALLSLAWVFRSFEVTDKPVYDSWNICRTTDVAPDGYLKFRSTDFQPVIAYESLGENTGRAYRLGQEFAKKYPDKYQRAEKIFDYARDMVRYTPDIDQFGHRDFAQNADEVEATLSKKGLARGDCEDSAVFLAVMYKGAGYRSAIVLVKRQTGGHVAALVYLPGYSKANRFLSVNGETGWVWGEATGKTNDLGWAPESCSEDNVRILLTREVK
jgi:transglutaminase-like putative cysteine protease